MAPGYVIQNVSPNCNSKVDKFRVSLSPFMYLTYFFVAAPRTSLAGQQFTVTALPCTDYTTDVLDSLLPV